MNVCCCKTQALFCCSVLLSGLRFQLTLYLPPKNQPPSTSAPRHLSLRYAPLLWRTLTQTTSWLAVLLAWLARVRICAGVWVHVHGRSWRV